MFFSSNYWTRFQLSDFYYDPKTFRFLTYERFSSLASFISNQGEKFGHLECNSSFFFCFFFKPFTDRRWAFFIPRSHSAGNSMKGFYLQSETLESSTYVLSHPSLCSASVGHQLVHLAKNARAGARSQPGQSVPCRPSCSSSYSNRLIIQDRGYRSLIITLFFTPLVTQYPLFLTFFMQLLSSSHIM